MPCRVEPYVDHPDAREELICFLKQQFSQDAGTPLWAQRLAHWWDANPWAAVHPQRGWVLRHETTLVGFLGIIPAGYAYEGKAIPALIATSWVVVQEHRNSALAMGAQLQKLGRSHLLLDSTPSPEVQRLISKMGWVGETQVRRRLLPMGLAGRLWAKLKRQSWPQLSPGRRIVTEVTEVQRLVRPWQQNGRLEKWITPEFLRWYASAPARKHQFLGVVDAEGTLTSYLWFTPRCRQGVRLWMLLEAFSTETDDAELISLVGALVRREVNLPGSKAWLISLLSFPHDSRWAELPALIQDEAQVCHFHSLPPELKGVPKHTVMAEGDFGL